MNNYDRPRYTAYKLQDRHRDRYIRQLENRLQRLESFVENIIENNNRIADEYIDLLDTGEAIGNKPLISNYKNKFDSFNSYPHDLNESLTNQEMLDSVLPINSRISHEGCMRSCNYIKFAKGFQGSKDSLSQYMYLMVCAEGCKQTIPCLNQNFCVPVMRENPEFFVQCANTCELFKIAPKIFKSAKC
ncbi:uncharacterized protein LOC128964073 [Oppia nitens]|uniref:uncharacterized protein LOC128964073 n=1 Tax=Oppia nitens TaxID=1686743 RepID=UPI0023DC214C|nr:uncharacterized protein LOC128964073 [Oppia nitens]